MSNSDFTSRVYEYSTSLKPIALNLTRNMDNAKDLLQETMLRALSSRDKFKEGTNLKAWLYTIMKNIFINNYRRKIKRKVIIDSTDNLFYLSPTERMQDNSGESKLNMDDISRAFEHISNDFKIPFLMHFKGFKYQEIADDLGLPIGTVKSRIHFARKDLKSKLNSYYNE
ncbi:MAG: RNA polymerase sigma factor [Bacteroidia bacterium]